MIDKWSVLEALRLMYAPAGADNELVGLCDAAVKELSLKLRPGADCGDFRLINAAAALANCRLLARNSLGGDGITAFKAGDVSITKETHSLAQRADEEYAKALLAALPLLTDDGFLFAKVDI